MLIADPNHLLHEADQISAAIATAEAYMATLTTKRAEIFCTLENLTRPVCASPAQERAFIRRGFVYLGDIFRSPTYLAIYLSVLKRLWMSFPEKRDAMAKEVSRSAYSRRYLARDRNALFSGMSGEWTLQHSTLLCEGWYADTNVNKQQIRKILSRAVSAAGLKWDEDVRVHWNTGYTAVPK